MLFEVRTRYAAFAIHLLISIIVLIALLAIIFYRWFPYDLIYAGGIAGLKILVGVDLVLGPALTLIVFDRTKKSLKFDLSAIAVFQIVCLLGGLWLIYNERPIAQVLADDGIHLHTTTDFELYQLEPTRQAGRTPHHILLDLPSSRESMIQLAITNQVMGNGPLSLRTDLFVPMSEVTRSTYEQRIKFIGELLDPETVAAMKLLPQLECDWLPLYSIHASGYACTTFDRGIIRLSERNLR